MKLNFKIYMFIMKFIYKFKISYPEIILKIIVFKLFLNINFNNDLIFF